MLQITPEINRQIQLDSKVDDALYCRACGHLITRRRWLLDRGASEHRLINPIGIVFTVICFTEAPGAGKHGRPNREHTWFEGYDWRFALCRGCETHLGWYYDGGTNPAGFFGLIKDKLSTGERSTGSEPGAKPE